MFKNKRAYIGVYAITFALLSSAAAYAQETSGDLLSLSGGDLRRELQTRYDAGLAGSLDPAIVSANDPRFIWATETKVQCGIAIGFMKSSTRDETSIRKCGDAYARFVGAPQVPQAQAGPTPDFCQQKVAGIVFFEFDDATPPAEATQTVDYVANNVAVCNWQGFTVAGHTDRAGSDAYNDALSRRRAEAVASLMQSRGIAPGAIQVGSYGETIPRVQTEDGVRNPQNRRVEITVN